MPHLEWNVPSGPIWVFFVVAVLICLAPWLAGRLRLPDILVLLVAGFLIGPHALGVVTADDTIIPALGQLGLLYLMFIAGAELDLDVIQHHRRSVAGFSVLTFGVPMTLGVGAGVLFGYGPAAALLIGSLWASHTLLTYSTVRNAGLAAQPAVASTVGATVVTDTLALTVLAGVAGAATGAQGGLDLAVQIVVGLLVLGGWCVVVLPRLGRFFYARLGHQPTIRYTFVLSALLSAAVLAEVVGIEGIVGAFFAGLGLNHLLPTHGRVFERVEFLGAALFIPLFLISVGLIVDPSVMAEPATLGLAAAFITASLGGKGLAALACRPLFGYSWPEVGVTFGMTSASAAATLAATFVGFQVGVIGTSVVNAVLIVILVSVLVSSISTTYFVQRVPRPAAHQASKPGRAILLVVASMDSASPALDFAARLAAADDGVVLPRVASLGPGSLDERHLADLERLIAGRGLDAEAVVRHDRSLADLARHAAQDEHATAVVVAEPTGALRDARVTETFRDLGARCPVPLFVVAAPRPFRSVRCVGPSSADGLVVEHLRRAGLEVAGSAQRPAALGRLLQRPQPPRPPDGTLVIMGPHDPWQVPEDTLLVAVATTAS